MYCQCSVNLDVKCWAVGTTVNSKLSITSMSASTNILILEARRDGWLLRPEAGNYNQTTFTMTICAALLVRCVDAIRVSEYCIECSNSGTTQAMLLGHRDARRLWRLLSLPCLSSQLDPTLSISISCQMSLEQESYMRSMYRAPVSLYSLFYP